MVEVGEFVLWPAKFTMKWEPSDRLLKIDDIVMVTVNGVTRQCRITAKKYKQTNRNISVTFWLERIEDA